MRLVHVMPAYIHSTLDISDNTDISKYPLTSKDDCWTDIEGLIQVVISYEIYEMSRTLVVISYEMTTNVRFCLSYDPLKLDFIALEMENISRRKRIVDTDAVNDVTSTRQSIITHVVIQF